MLIGSRLLRLYPTNIHSGLKVALIRIFQFMEIRRIQSIQAMTTIQDIVIMHVLLFT